MVEACDGEWGRRNIVGKFSTRYELVGWFSSINYRNRSVRKPIGARLDLVAEKTLLNQLQHDY